MNENKEMEALERMLTYKIASKSKFGMKNVEDYNLVKSALTELEEIKKRAEEVISNSPYGYFTENQIANIVDEIIYNGNRKGESK